MALSSLDDKSKKPTAKSLAGVLGKTLPLWKEIQKHLKEEYGNISEVWQFAGEKYGWNMKVIRKKRTILYLTPCKNYFMQGFVLGDKAIAAAKKSDLAKSVLDIIKNAPRYGEGTGFRIDVKLKKDVKNIKRLIQIKVDN